MQSKFEEYCRLCDEMEWNNGAFIPTELQSTQILPAENHFLQIGERPPVLNGNQTSKQKRLVAFQRILIALNSVGFNRNFASVKRFDKKYFKFVCELAFLLKAKNSSTPIDENWENSVFGNDIDFVNSGTLFKSYRNDRCRDNQPVDCIRVVNPSVPDTLRRESRLFLMAQIELILSDPYILHFLSKSFDFENHSDAREKDFYVLNPNYPRQSCPFTEMMVEKSADILLKYAHCIECCVGFETEEQILTHINAKHKDYMDINYAEELTNIREQRKIKQAKELCQEIHDFNHTNCTECIFETDRP